MNKTEREIVALLKEDSRISAAQIAAALSISADDA